MKGYERSSIICIVLTVILIPLTWFVYRTVVETRQICEKEGHKVRGLIDFGYGILAAIILFIVRKTFKLLFDDLLRKSIRAPAKMFEERLKLSHKYLFDGIWFIGLHVLSQYLVKGN